MTSTIFLASDLLEVLLPTHRRQQLMGAGLLMMMQRAKDVPEEAGFVNDLVFKGEY
jgi:hypothetical protein